MAASIESLKVKLAALTESISVAVESDDNTEQAELRQDLSDMHQQLTELVQRVRAKLVEAEEVKSRADRLVEWAEAAVEKLDDLLIEVAGAAEQLAPDAWEWTDDAEGEGERGAGG